jgi:hypothetical protein
MTSEVNPPDMLGRLHEPQPDFDMALMGFVL